MADEFNDIIEKLENTDFSSESDKQAVYKNVMRNVNKTANQKNGGIYMNRKIKRVSIVAATILIITGSVVQSAFAEDGGIIGKIISTFSLEHVIVNKEEELPEEDRTNFEKFQAAIESGEITENIFNDDSDDMKYFVVNDITKINEGYTCFDIVLPEYIPEGFSFDRAEFYCDEDGKVSMDSKYGNFYYVNESNDKFIFIQQRFADEETAFATEAKDVEKIKINDVDGLLYEKNLDWEKNGVIYSILGRKAELSNEDIIKMAESVK